MESKICSKCNMMKTLIEYYFDSSKRKYRSDCKECNKYIINFIDKIIVNYIKHNIILENT